VLPPPDGPALSVPVLGGTATEVIVQWSSASPVPRTPLGPHTLTIRAAVAGAPAGNPPLLSLDTPLDALGGTEPVTGSGTWITGTAAGVTTYRAVLRRAATTDVLRVLIRITDPLGRIGERTLDVGPGDVLPEPDIGRMAVTRITGTQPQSILRFTSTSPVVNTASGPYRLKVTALPPIRRLIPPPPSLDVPLPDVPSRVPVRPLPPLSIVRSGSGPAFSYTVVAQGNVGSFAVRITAPDGRSATKSAS
jgi:hypothetical protein